MAGGDHHPWARDYATPLGSDFSLGIQHLHDHYARSRLSKDTFWGGGLGSATKPHEGEAEESVAA